MRLFSGAAALNFVAVVSVLAGVDFSSIQEYGAEADGHFQGRTRAEPFTRTPCSPGEYHDENGCTKCPAGRAGAEYGIEGASSCVACRLGHYCPEGSTSDEALPCPGGRFGSMMGLKDSRCSGECSPGYICTQRSTNPKPRPCGNISFFCPSGTSVRNRVSLGYYSIGGDRYTRSGQALCEPGYYCVDGIRRMCEAGRYGNETGLHNSNCSGLCPVGHYCPINSNQPTPCPAGRFASSTGNSENSCNGACAKGHYCPIASVSKQQRKCPAGSYGNVTGLKTKECNPLCVDSLEPCVGPTFCEPGYYCPENSTSSKMFECGSVNLYCPLGSTLPINVSPGYYTTVGYLGDEEYDDPGKINVRDSQRECPKGSYCVDGVKRLCPAGTYGGSTGLTSAECSGKCRQGYFCKIGASSDTESKCGNPKVYCPLGSFSPTIVSNGYYTITGGPLTRSNQTICQPGYYCTKGIRRKCPAGKYGLTHGLNTSICTAICPAGSYCVINSVSPTMCPAGRFGSKPGLTSSACSGPCRAGWYCPLGSVKDTQEECGGEHVYCPTGSSNPLPVEEGYFAADGADATIRQDQVICDGDAALSAFCPKTTM